MSWRPEGWENPFPLLKETYTNGDFKVVAHQTFETGADKMHKADIKWLIERITHDDRGYVFKMTDKEWQEFIK